MLERAIGSDDEPGEIDRFWQEIFDRFESGPAYRSPDRFLAYDADNLPNSECVSGVRPDSLLNNAFYCADDSTLAWDDDWFQRLHQIEGFEFAPLAIIAHEWGHHVQSLLGQRITGLAAELQADCYASFYINDAEELSGMEEEQRAYAQIQFFLLGNMGFSDSAWFEPGEHGSPALRSMAVNSGRATTALNGMLEDSDPLDWVADLSYCRDYEVADFEPMRAFKAGPFAVNGLPNSTTEVNEDGSIDLVHPVATTRIVFLPELIRGTPARYLTDVLNSYFGPSAETDLLLVGEPNPIELIGGRTALIQSYQHSETRSGAQQLRHGIFVLDVLPGVGGLILDITNVGPRPADGNDWAPFLAHMLAVSQAMCSPDEHAFGACLFSELDWMGLPDVTVQSTREGIELNQWVLDPGPTLFTFVNTEMTNIVFGGPEPIASGFVLVKLSDTLNLTPTRPPSESPTNRIAATPEWFYGATIVGGPYTPGAFTQSQVVVDLSPGEWVVVGYPFLTPISPPFTVRESDTTRESVEPLLGAEIVLNEDGMSGFEDVQPGHQVWRVSNAGDEPHELLLFRFPDGATEEEIIAWAQYVSAPEGTASPDALGFDPDTNVENDAALAVISSGQSVIMELQNLLPGTYAALCFVPDQHSDGVHWELGEVTVIRVGIGLGLEREESPLPTEERPSR